MYTEENIPHAMCRDCKYFKIDADRRESLCKRIDHKYVKFFKPYFKSYCCGEHHTVCCEFEPKFPDSADFKDKWTCFEDFFPAYKSVWCTSEEIQNGFPFVVNDNFGVIYRVPFEKFVYGNVVEGGILQANMKLYSKRSKSSPTGYEIVRQKINGVNIVEVKRNEE